MRRLRLKAWLYTWLLASFVLTALLLFLYAGGVAERKPQDGGFLACVAFGFFAGLLALPTRWLLCIFPEPSPSSGVRFVRRVVVGICCGEFAAGLLAGLIALRGTIGMDLVGLLAVAGPALGVIVGVVDAIMLDQEAGAAP